MDDLQVTVEDNQLVIRGKQQDEGERVYLHRGIAARQFQRSFVLAVAAQEELPVTALGQRPPRGGQDRPLALVFVVQRADVADQPLARVACPQRLDHRLVRGKTRVGVGHDGHVEIGIQRMHVLRDRIGNADEAAGTPVADPPCE